MQEFLQRACSLDIQCVEEDFVARVEHQSWSSVSVVIFLHVVLCFVDCGFGFIDCCPHPFRELVDCLWTRRVLPGFEAYARKSSGIELEWRLLGGRVDVIVVLELCHG